MGNKPILYTENVTKKFGGLLAVSDVSMHLNKGEILGLIGTNGAGKTTLFNMLAGALKPTSGRIYYHGKAINGLKPYKICKKGIARTFQIVQPFSDLTVKENVMVGCLNRRSSVNEAERLADEILERINLSHQKDNKGGSLNLPELKRMEIGRALATEPEVLLLDEVMAGLTQKECEDAMEIVRRIRDSGITIIVIEHVMKAIMNISDRIYVLNQGGLIAEGKPEEISVNKEVINSYLGEMKHDVKSL